MRKKRKGTELLCPNRKDVLGSTSDDSGSARSNLRCHYSLEDYDRLKKRCKEGVESVDETVGSCRVRLAGIAATAPACATTSLSGLSGRGIKRKIGCIDAATQMGRKNKIEDDFISGATIGKGKFGSVWLCRSKVSEEDFACKTLHKGEETVHREVEIMQHLSGHPGVVTLKAVYEDPKSFHLVMELCSGGRLIDQMTKQGRYSEQQAANIFKDLMLVIKYCHEMGVVHRDIKPENILLTNSDQSLNGIAGSPAYVAPEVLLGNYSEKVDIWSAGVLLYALLAGALPFKGNSLEDVFEAIKTVKLDFQAGIWESISKPLRDLLERILTRDAAARITADEILAHPWILFYTERTLRTLSFKSKTKNQPGSHHLPVSFIPNSSRKIRDSNFVDDDSSRNSSSESLSQEKDEQDDCGFVDALAVAISHVTISEPKRSRLCGPTSPIREQCSSNVTSNSLCKAF
ncbi:serine/threonine-protein kinase PEPKR2 isoform X2 [Daucus carota subsp. sativus]|uniref:serine/threonine-protein kinase PEPKR2 isoform X2 n=1 Tax=Daucus carota subsp. sativus TaxID=79200 RepID=UPI0007F0428C|nr:PREDICTED: serine/threonine-protein kinase PEPKR2-like isoform X2 [Daucus carota subsp. sativus]